MPSWNELLNEFNTQNTDQKASAWLTEKSTIALQEIGELRSGRQVILYGSGFLQKPQAQGSFLSISTEDLNGLMAVVYGMDWTKGLTLILHTPGGVVTATESIVDYLRSKFADIEVIVPALAMSAGTMIALSSNRIVMGRQSQLGPIDPQMGVGGRSVSAQAIVDQFGQAKREVLANPMVAHAWAPVLQSLGPALLVEAQNALDYGESMVARWLEQYMLDGQAGATAKAAAIAHHFNDAGTHKSHGRRINRTEAQAAGVVVESLEDDQKLQEKVLTAYHLMTLAFEHGPATKVMWADTGKVWVKNWVDPKAAVQATTSPAGPAQRSGLGVPAQAAASNRAQRRQQGKAGR